MTLSHNNPQEQEDTHVLFAPIDTGFESTAVENISTTLCY